MAQLPIVPGSEVNTPIGGVQMNPQAFREAALAPGKLAEAIGSNVSGVFDQVSEQVQAARNSKLVFDAALQMRATKDQFLNDIQKDPNLAKDPGTWVPEWQRRAQATSEAILGKSMGPLVKRQMMEKVGIWGMESTSEIRTHALGREATDTYNSGMALATKDFQDGRISDGINAYKALNETGLMGPKELAVRIQQAPELAAESAAVTAMTTDPISAPDNIKNLAPSDKPQDPNNVQPRFSNPAKYKAALRSATIAQGAAQHQNAQELSASIIQDPLHTMPQQADGWLKSGKLNSTGYEALGKLVKSYAAADKKQQEEKQIGDVENAYHEASQLPNDLSQLDSEATRVKNLALHWTNLGEQKRFYDKVDGEVKRIKAGAERDIEGQVIHQMNEDRNQNGLTIPMQADIKEAKSHWFSADEPEKVGFTHFAGSLEQFRRHLDDPNTDIEAEYGKGMTREKVLAAEQQMAAHQQHEVRNKLQLFQKAHGRPATPDEADEMRKEVERPYVTAATQAELSKHVPVPVSSEDDFEELPAGAKFIWNGRVGTKN